MPYTDAAKNSMLASLVGKAAPVVIDAVSLHSADPGTTGASEVASGAYARIAVTEADFNAPATGACVLNNDKTFAAAAAQGVTHWGAWDGATFVGSGPVSGDAAFNAEGVYVLKAGTSMDLNG